MYNAIPSNTNIETFNIEIINQQTIQVILYFSIPNFDYVYIMLGLQMIQTG